MAKNVQKNEISNIVKATVTVNPENAALIITCSGFEVK